MNLTEKEIDDIGDEMKNYIYIRDLNVSKNKLPNIRGVENMDYIVRIDARENEIREVELLNNPDKFKHLLYLYLSTNKIKKLPAMYANNLLELHADGNNITSCENFTGLKNLKLITLNQNKLKDCQGLRNCPKLELLRLVIIYCPIIS